MKQALQQHHIDHLHGLHFNTIQIVILTEAIYIKVKVVDINAEPLPIYRLNLVIVHVTKKKMVTRIQ